jgi:predicted Zn-dependent peptidase
MHNRSVRSGIVLAFCVIGWVALPVVPVMSQEPAGVQPREVELDNGLTLLLVERHDEPTVAAGVFYDVGSVNDPRGKSGIAHLFEHMLFKGSKVIGTTDFASEQEIIKKQDVLREKMNTEMERMRELKRRGEIADVLDPGQWTPAYRDMQKEYDALVAAARAFIKNNEFANLYTTNGGARMNAGTMHDLTMYFVQLPANKIELFFWLESDRMANGIMREFYVERDNVREERRLRVESTPTGKLDEAFEAMFWQAHPYGIPVLGWPSEVESITRDDVYDFYRVYYAPNNATVVVVGDFQSDDVIGLTKRYFGRIPRGTTKPPAVITEEEVPGAERRFHAEAETNPQVRIRFHTVAIGHRDEPALDVLAELMSGKTGRLYKRLVATDNVAIGEPSASHQARKYAGHLELRVTVKEGIEPEIVETLMLQELERIRTEEISDHELQKVKNQVLASSVRRLKSNFGLMFQLGVYETWLDWSYVNDAPKRMLAVGAKEVLGVLDTYLNPDARVVSVYRTATETPTESAPDAPAVIVAAAKAPEKPQRSEPVGTVPPPAIARELAPGVILSFDPTTDPELMAMMEKLPEKFHKELLIRMQRLLETDDPDELDMMINVLGGAVQQHASRLGDHRTELLKFIVRRTEERYYNVLRERIERAERGEE